MNRAFVIVQISDLHIDGSRTRAPALETLIATILDKMTEYSKRTADRILLITGDLMNDPTESAILETKLFMENIRKLGVFTDVVAIPGNHDVKRLGLLGRIRRDAYAVLGLPMGAKNIYYKQSGLDLVLLDSNGASFARGEINEEAYASLVTNAALLSRQLRNTGADRTQDDFVDPLNSIVRLLALHHHPLPHASGEGKTVFGLPDEPFMYLIGPATFLDAAISLDVKLILHGHRHVHGFTRYSVPRKHATTAEIEDEFWKTIYVLSCPSSTGMSCDAGFNIIHFAPQLRGGKIGYGFEIVRYTRPGNTGAFKPLDALNRGIISLPADEYYHRDPALQVEIELLSAKVAGRDDVIAYARRLLRRRAFYSVAEGSWAHALYAYIVTYHVWSRSLLERFDVAAFAADRAVARNIGNHLYALIELCGKVLGLNGYELDNLRGSRLADQEKMLRQIPRQPRANIVIIDAEAERLSLVNKIDAEMRDLGETLYLGHEAPQDLTD
jgi:Icc protein